MALAEPNEAARQAALDPEALAGEQLACYFLANHG